MIKLEWRHVAPGDGPAVPTSLTANEIEALKALAPGSYILEIGSAYGYSAVSMALAGGHVTAVDVHSWIPGSLETMTQLVASYGVIGGVDIMVDDSRVMMPDLVKQGRTFDLVWIDGDHEEATVAQDVHWGRQLLKSTGTLACHDYDEATCPGVKAALDKWKVPPRLVDTLALYGPGEW